ncbi:MAG: hypothetical protein PHS04_16590 [Tissierellia bacterium]|nr:hypothetical protein [Tissierellia bacterium]
MNNDQVDWKIVILSRWAGEYPPAKEGEEAILKDSQEIANDLMGAGEFTADEVSMFLATSGYKIVFDGGYPKWQISGGDNTKIIKEY